jgi:hypothetical protein
MEMADMLIEVKWRKQFRVDERRQWWCYAERECCRGGPFRLARATVMLSTLEIENKSLYSGFELLQNVYTFHDFEDLFHVFIFYPAKFNSMCSLLLKMHSGVSSAHCHRISRSILCF